MDGIQMDIQKPHTNEIILGDAETVLKRIEDNLN